MPLTPLTLARRINEQYNDYTEQHPDTDTTTDPETANDTPATVRLTPESYEELHEHAQTPRALAATIASLCACSVSIQRAADGASTDTISFGEASIPLTTSETETVK